MKTKHFYSYLIETSDIYLELGELDLTPKERVHLISIVDANIHSVVIKTVLSNLATPDKKIFLKNLSTKDSDKIWEHLKKATSDIESRIKKEIEELKKELYKDIQEVK